ncbi:MAG TPA: hypothetical protein VFI42_12975 [Thermomicrobiaceae bacterium]|nr:hypothetical protein [Thermomicrobiaceae bacterium]
MSLPKISIAWPIDGGIDTLRAPLSVQPGSHLQLDNVIQVRKNEWRRRNGFTQSALDTFPGNSCPFFVGTRGSGLIAMDSEYGWSRYSPSLGSNRWSSVNSGTQAAETFTRTPVIETDTTNIGFAVTANFWLIAHLGSGATARMILFDKAAKIPVSTTDLGSSYLRVRGAATSTHMVMFAADNAGNLNTYVVNVSTGVVTGPTTIKTGLHTTQPYLDAIWYGGSTITVVARTSVDSVRFIEFNPATGALAADLLLVGVSCANALSLFHDPDASGQRFVAASHTTPTTRVIRCNSAGAITTNDQVEAINASQIAGIASNAGADWTVVYRRSSDGVPRSNAKLAGVVGAPGNLQNTATDLQIDSQMWSEPGFTAGRGEARFIVGLHSATTDDPQDTWVEVAFSKGSAATVIFDPRSSLVPLNAAQSLAGTAASLYQVVRTGARTYSMALPVLAHYSNDAGTITRRYSIDVFEQQLLSGSEIAAVNVGNAVPLFGRTALFPGGVTSYSDEGWIRNLGTYNPPRLLTLTPGAGGALTPSTRYGYTWIVEAFDEDGNVWRSPQAPTTFVDLSPVQNRVTVAYSLWNIQERSRRFRFVFFRTDGNGSQLCRIRTDTVNNGSFVDDLADSVITNDDAIKKGEILYTTGLPPTEITPPFSHLALFGDRLWGVNRDYRTELWPSRNLRPGRQPEFVADNVIDLDDGFGDITNVASMDDKGVVFKQSAVYFIQGDGKSDAGTGEAHTYVQISSDEGAVEGSPVVSTGDRVYFVAERGIHSVDKAANVDFVGAPVDQYLHQPDVQTPETIYDACFVPSVNEVRFVTTNYILVYNRTFGTWTRWTGLSGMRRCLVVDGVFWLFKSDGTVWKEGTSAQTTDQGVAFTGEIRSPWIRPAFEQGGTKATMAQQGIRLRRGRVLFTRTAGGAGATLIGKIYRDNDDAKIETFTSAAVIGSVLSGTGEMNPTNQKCRSFSLALVLPSGDTTVRVEGFAAAVSPRKGDLAVDGSSKWGAP